jgi:hypothetical protein
MKWGIYGLLIVLIILHFWRCWKDEEPWLKPSLVLIVALCVITVLLVH